jgi:broad specificity phosphatase PhoE
MGKLILIRHGESEGNAIRRFTTTPDAAITDLGRRQALEAAIRIKILFNPSRIVASPYFRARETARIIGDHLGLPIEIEPAFREQSLGDLAGKSYDIVREDPSFIPERSWEWRPPGGESQMDVRHRTAPVLDNLMRAHPEHEVLVVSHGGVMRALWAHMTNQWDGAYVPTNCGIVVVDHDGARYLMPRVLEGDADSDRETGG